MAKTFNNLLDTNWQNNPDNDVSDLADGQYLSAEDFKVVLDKIKANETLATGAVKTINYNGVDFTPNASGQVDIVVANTGITTELTTPDQASQQYLVTTDGIVKLKLRFTSIQTKDGVSFTDTFEQAKLTLYSSTIDSDDWGDPIARINLNSVPYNSTDYIELDISEYIPSGSSKFRISAVGSTSLVYANELIFSNIVKTSISLTFANQWYLPMVGDTLELFFRYSGSVAKTLHIMVDDEEVLSPTLGISTSIETAQQYAIPNIYQNGVHTIKAWLSIDNSSIVTPTLQYDILILDSEDNTRSYFWVSEPVTEVNNFEQTVFCKYAVWNLSQATFKIQSYDGETEYLNYTQAGLENKTEYSFANTLEIDSRETSIPSYVRIYDIDGGLLNNKVVFTVSNSSDFNPTSGADFILNPKLRDNKEAHPNTIINAAKSTEIPATFTNFGFVADGWVEEGGIKRLRVPAGKYVTIDYEAFSQLLGSARKTSSLTIELDYKVFNVQKEDEPVIKMCTYLDAVDGMPLGLEMTPYQACFLTVNNRVKGDQDIMYQDETRTHVALNIVYNLSASGLNYVRFFVDGIINREFTYRADDVFVQGSSSGGIRIGSSGADIDIFGIKVYKKALSASNIRQDYLASFDTSLQKQQFLEANNILDDTSQISYNKVYGKLNTLLWRGSEEVSLDNQKGDNGDLIINIIGDPAHSGILHNMTQKGQGTSSKKYWKWNIQYGFVSMNMPGNVETEQDMLNSRCSYWEDYNNVKHYKAEYDAKNNQTKFSSYYQVQEGEQKATKLVAKRNWASSMQSHKMGATALYTDLWREIVGGNSITGTKTNPTSKASCRVSVLEKPFMYFVQADESKDPIFMGFMTFGAGKGDKPTFGIGDNSLMLEGSKNYAPIFERRVPWIKGEDNSGEETWYCDDESNEELNECYVYNGEAVADFGMGSREHIDYFVNAFNFTYLHTNHIAPFDGTYEQLQEASGLNQYTQYWVTTSSASAEKFDLFRYNPITETYVPAGITKNADGTYETLNINIQCGSKYIASNVDYDAINKYFINWRVTDFKNHLADYYNVTDTLYHQAFCKMIGASDNRCKNTYEYIDPADKKIRFFQDDLDTILATDNVGRKNKPYYVEEHDYQESGAPYWNSENSYFYDLLDVAYPAEQRSMMRSILTAMASLGGGSVAKCMEKYFFYVQKYFPAVAYNETARILYEAASVKYNNGTYTNDTNPMTQSLGDQLQAEMQWWKRREIYLSSYASYGEFNSPFLNSLSFRSISNLAGSSNPQVTFKLTPHMWLYPVESVDNSLQYGKAEDGTTATLPQRVKAGDTFEITTNIGNDISNYIAGINYYSNVGEFTNIPVGQTFILNGKHLTEFIAHGTEFRVTGISNVTAAALKKLDLAGTNTITGIIDLSACTKLEELNLKDTRVTNIYFPETETLKHLYLPSTLISLAFKDNVYIEEIYLDNADAIQTIDIENCSDVLNNFVLDLLFNLFELNV